MFYEILGVLIQQAARSIESLPANSELSARGQRDLRRVLLLLSRAGAIWPGVFAALATENAILQRTLDETRSVIEFELQDSDLANALAMPEDDDPLRLHVLLLRDLDRCVSLLHEVGEDWSSMALRVVRRGLFDAAEVQQRLIEGAVSG